MATAKITKKQIQQDEFLDTVFDLGEWFEAHWKPVAAGAGAVVVLVLVFVAWNASRERAGEAANGLLAQGLAAYTPDGGGAPRYAEALPLFEEAAEKGGSGGVGDIARFFRAQTLVELGRAQEAVPILEGLASGGNERIAGTAKASLAGALEASGNLDRAATVLQELASAPSPTYPQDAALMLLSELRERQGRSDDARKACEDLLSRFPQSAFANEARQRVGAR